MSPDLDPLVGPAPAEVSLPTAPLVRVIAQVRFSPILTIQKPDFIAPFHEAIRPAYPVLRHLQPMALGPEGVSTGPKQMTWRFSDLEGAWRVSLAPDFAALETTSYTSRGDFLDRFGSIVRALEGYVKPVLVQRFGLRYIDRVEGDTAREIARLVRPEMLGILATSLSDHTQHAISETIFELRDSHDRLRMRWGHVPPQVTVDPTAIEPVDILSWLLDLDMFSTEERPFSTDAIIAAARRYAERLYAMFRWAVTDEFLRRYGGKP